jgi:hypothetical protein
VSGRWTTWLAWSMCALYLVCAGISQVILVLRAEPDFWETLSHNLVLFLFAVVGGLIVSRRRNNAVGWILCALAIVYISEDVSAQYAAYALFIRPGSLPAGVIAAWLQSWLWAVSFGLMAFLLLLFPNGRPTSRHWRAVAWTAAAASVLLAVGMAVSPGPIGNRDVFQPIENPFGLVGPAPQVIVHAAFGLLNLCLLLAATSMIVRFRRARGVERQQMKWFAVAATLLAATFIVNFVYQYLPELQAVSRAAFLVAFASLAVAIGIAILRHRLYDIDRLINRAVVYAALSTGLGLVYWASVVLLQQLLRPFTQGSELAIIVSTLAVAALFSPARRQIQNVVDRRFYRRTYDAQRTLETFSATLRQEVDLDSLNAELLAVISRAMQPERVSLWLRPIAAGPHRRQEPRVERH